MQVTYFFLFFMSVLLSQGCRPEAPPTDPVAADSLRADTPNTVLAAPAPVYTLADFWQPDETLQAAVDSVYASLDTVARIGQTITMMVGEHGLPAPQIRYMLKKYRLGGLVALNGEIDALHDLLAGYQAYADSVGVLPLWVAADAEPTLLNSKIRGSAAVPRATHITHPRVSEAVAWQIAGMLNELGVHQNYAPVCDFSENQAIIHGRSFGNRTQTVVPLTDAFIQGTQAQGVVATAKHFPGHGRAQGDTHKQLVYLQGPPAELPVFQSAIEAGVLSVMVGHLAIRGTHAWNTNGLPATLSRRVVTDWLRDSLNFDGLIVTDALNMRALDNFEQAPSRAMKAGCDMVLHPESLADYQQAVWKEIQDNEAFANQIRASVKRIVRLKICAGLLKTPSVKGKTKMDNQN